MAVWFPISAGAIDEPGSNACGTSAREFRSPKRFWLLASSFVGHALACPASACGACWRQLRHRLEDYWEPPVATRRLPFVRRARLPVRTSLRANNGDENSRGPITNPITNRPPDAIRSHMRSSQHEAADTRRRRRFNPGRREAEEIPSLQVDLRAPVQQLIGAKCQSLEAHSARHHKLKHVPPNHLPFTTSALTANGVAMSGSSSFTRFSEFAQEPSPRCVRRNPSATALPASTCSACKAWALDEE